MHAEEFREPDQVRACGHTAAEPPVGDRPRRSPEGTANVGLTHAFPIVGFGRGLLEAQPERGRFGVAHPPKRTRFLYYSG